MQRLETNAYATLARVGHELGNTVGHHLARIFERDARATTHHHHKGIRVQRGSFIRGAKVVFDVLPSLLGRRGGEHAASANARDVQAGVVDGAYTRGEAGLLDLVPPKCD
jgi:hypothetical protein